MLKSAWQILNNKCWMTNCIKQMTKNLIIDFEIWGLSTYFGK